MSITMAFEVERLHVELFLAHQLTDTFDDMSGFAVGGGDVFHQAEPGPRA